MRIGLVSLVMTPSLITCGALLGGCKGDTYNGPTSIMVTSEPSGAAVRLDDREAGCTPVLLDVEPAHNHTIRLSYAGHHSVRASISRAYNNWNYPGGGTATTLYASVSTGPCAPLTAIIFSPLIAADAVYAVPYLLRSAESEDLPPVVHAVLPPVLPGEKERVIEWKEEGRAERLAAAKRARSKAAAAEGESGPPALAAAVPPPAPPPEPAHPATPPPVYAPRVTP